MSRFFIPLLLPFALSCSALGSVSISSSGGADISGAAEGLEGVGEVLAGAKRS